VIPLKDNIPTDRFPIVTAVPIVANFVVYLLAIRHGGSFISGPGSQAVLKYGAIPFALTHPGAHCAEVAQQTASGTQSVGVVCNSQLLEANNIPPENPLPGWQTVFTSMFMHASILHIAGNMLFLWIFGNNVEGAMGPVRYIFFYILGGIAALALLVAIAPSSTAPIIGAWARSPLCSAATSSCTPALACSRWS
jgi:membrane associated rhomboid family serine protease